MGARSMPLQIMRTPRGGDQHERGSQTRTRRLSVVVRVALCPHGLAGLPVAQQEADDSDPATLGHPQSALYVLCTCALGGRVEMCPDFDGTEVIECRRA